MPVIERQTNTYYLTGWVKITAADEEDALRKFEEAGLGIDVEVVDGVVVNFDGPWDEIERNDVPRCTCPPALVKRGGFRSDCLVCA